MESEDKDIPYSETDRYKRLQRLLRQTRQRDKMEAKPKYVKFEQDAVIILVDSDDLNIPVKDLKICGLCTLSYKKPVYHYSPSSPAKPPVSDGRTSENRSDSNEKRTAQDRGAVLETGGGFIRASPFVCKGIKRTKNGKA